MRSAKNLQKVTRTEQSAVCVCVCQVDYSLVSRAERQFKGFVTVSPEHFEDVVKGTMWTRLW